MKLPTFSQLEPKQIPLQLNSLLEHFQKDITQRLEDNTNPLDLLMLIDEQGEKLERFWSPCGHMNAVLGSELWRDCYSQCLPQLTAYDTFLHQNETLYQRLNQADKSNFSPSQKKICEDFLIGCRLSGIGLGKEKREQVQAIFERLDQLQQKFDNHIIDSQKQFQFHTDNLESLAGLPAHLIDNAKAYAHEKQQAGYLLYLDQPTYFAVVTYAKDANLRETFFKAYNTRASEKSTYDQGKFDNTSLIQETLVLREKLAHLVGLQNYVEYSLSLKMAKTRQRVEHFLQTLLEDVVPVAKKDMQVVEQYAKDHGHQGKLQPWDVPYYVQLRQKEVFLIDQEALRVYFPLNHVMKAINQLLESLYGIHLQKDETVDVWHKDAECYRLMQGDRLIGLLYCDWFSRQGKRGGAWMDTLQTRTANQLPIATLTCNFAPPVSGEQAGLTHDEFTTLLHELGHCLHHLLSEVDHYSVSGVHGVEWDAVELPSQWMENWGWQKQWVKIFSHHMQTGESLPDDQFKQLLAVKNDLVGLFLLRQLIFATYDFSIHSLPPPQTSVEVNAQYQDLLKQYAVWPVDQNARFPQTFSHIFAGGYAAGYYSYLWADVLSCDVFEWFEKQMSNIGECGQAFRKKVLSKGGSLSALDAFVSLMGREPDQSALLRSYGLL